MKSFLAPLADCTAWLNACQTSWSCGSEYDRQLYEARPPPACPFPGDNYVPPTQPALCTFNQQQGQCQFEACVNGMVYESCGSACPRTCDNINSTSSCIEVCTEGCFCSSGLVQLGGTCVQPSECKRLLYTKHAQTSSCFTTHLTTLPTLTTLPLPSPHLSRSMCVRELPSWGFL